MTDEEPREEARPGEPSREEAPPGQPSRGEDAPRKGEAPRAQPTESAGLQQLEQFSAQQALASGAQRAEGGPGRGGPAGGGTGRAGAAGAGTARTLLVGLGLLCLAAVAAVGGYAANLAFGDPASASGGAAAQDEAAEDSGEDEAPDPGPFGNPAGLSYTRLGGTDFLVVRQGAALVTLSPQSAQATEAGVSIEFAAEYHPQDGEHTVRAEDFFHYAHPGGTVPDAGQDDLGITPEAAELAVLTPEEPMQRFTVELPGAPYTGALSYNPAEELDLDLEYRTPLCYHVDGDFSPHREDCEAVPGPEGF